MKKKNLKAQEWFKISGRGSVAIVPGHNSEFKLDEILFIDDKKYIIIGIEGPSFNKHTGLLVREVLPCPYEDILNNLVKARCGGKVERCHTIPHMPGYTNAAHSWGVAMLMFYLFPEDFPRLSIYCLTHDIGEGWTGDIPAPALWAIQEVRNRLESVENSLIEAAGCPRVDQLTKEDHEKLKICDRFELYLWCREQRNLGNLYVNDCIAALEEYFKDLPMSENIRKFCNKMLRRASEHYLPEQQGVVQELFNNEG